MVNAYSNNSLLQKSELSELIESEHIPARTYNFSKLEHEFRKLLNSSVTQFENKNHIHLRKNNSLTEKSQRLRNDIRSLMNISTSVENIEIQLKFEEEILELILFLLRHPDKWADVKMALGKYTKSFF